ncbi:glycosyltransferase [Peristeroidobacter soli]|uniref:glycosyltransferase n=1 Tax=Peristeroidobacter soli TaxID=2497877 RepID=UPI00158E4F63|nr:glycosyltransferase [Peristeroidobacter soli]
MSDANFRQIRVLHLVSAGGVASALQPALFMPLLTRLPRQRVKSQVACLSPGAVPSAVLRQNGVPTFDLALSRKRFSPKAFQELVQSTRNFRPDVIQAWGHTAQVISTLLRKRCDWKPRLVWSVSETTPLAKNAGFIDRQKLKYAARFSTRADRIVYASESGASQHRRVGFPDGGHETVPPGVDATRFKPDFAARRKLREELSLPGETFVIGMVAPFQAEYDHSTLIRAVGELIKTNPNIALVLAGHGVQKGNAPLMALVGGGSMATRVHLLGEWSDINGLYNACDVVCSSAVSDQSRMNVVMAMLCGVPVVATGIGAQGELIGQHGVAIEPGSPTAFVKGINRVMQLTPEKRTQMAQGARKHALANYVYVRSLQKYLQLYYDLIGRQSLVTKDLPTPEIDEALTVPPALPTEAEINASKRKPITVVDLSDPDSLESRVSERQPEELPKWRIEQEQERAKREAEVEAKVAASQSVGDVLEVFESQRVKALSSESPMTERARGVADDSEELLSQELLEVDAPPPTPRVSNAPSGARKSSAPSPAQAAPQPDAAKQAALKAARMAALQPIAPAAKPTAAPKAASAVTRPPVSAPAASSPITRPPVSAPAASSPTNPQPVSASTASSPITRPPVSTPATSYAITPPPVSASAASSPLASTAAASSPTTRPSESTPATAASVEPPKSAESASLTIEGAPPKVASPVAAVSIAPIAAKTAAKVDTAGTQPLETLPEGTQAGLAALKLPDVVDVSSTTAKRKVDISSTQPLGTLAENLAKAALSGKDLAEAARPALPGKDLAEATKPALSGNDLAGAARPALSDRDLARAARPVAPSTAASKPDVSKSGASKPALSKPDDANFDLAEPDVSKIDAFNLDFDLEAFAPADPEPVAAPSLKARVDVVQPKAVSVSSASEEAPIANGSMTEFGELTLLATGEWQAMQRTDTAKPETKAKTEPARQTKPDELSDSQTLSLISKPAPDELALVPEPEPRVESKRAANGE